MGNTTILSSSPLRARNSAENNVFRYIGSGPWFRPAHLGFRPGPSRILSIVFKLLLVQAKTHGVPPSPTGNPCKRQQYAIMVVFIARNKSTWKQETYCVFIRVNFFIFSFSPSPPHPHLYYCVLLRVYAPAGCKYNCPPIPPYRAYI